jgi:DNA polymerase-4
MTAPAARTILHVDMDAFYASVEALDQPDLQGHAIIVGGLGPRGVVATANYLARASGVHSAMPMSRARRLCPQAAFIQPRMERYREASEQVFSIFHRITPLVEGLSLDEAFLDVTASLRLFGSAREMGLRVKALVRQEVGLTASVGISHNKFLATLASDLQKPDGLVCVAPDRVHQVLDPMPITRLWGIGPHTAPKLKALGILTIGQLRRADLAAVRSVLGNRTAHFCRLAAGEDEREVIACSPDKSISHEITFDRDLLDNGLLLAELQAQAEAVAGRLRKQQLTARTVTIKIRDSRFRTVTRSRSMRAGSNSTMTLYRLARALFEAWRAANAGTPVRLLGMGASGLEPRCGAGSAPGAAAGNQVDSHGSQKLDQVFDSINGRYGSGGIVHGLTLKRRRGDTEKT